ncbi:MAG TPA: heavy metal translocating P-type ATPase [Candidatus Dormibacteraeota bacterium]|nr:heavy metal translocating P-type ATPase [Candidatus Dormibacteraeota bacterium]
MKRFVRLLIDYRLFSLAFVTIIAGIILELSGQRTAVHWLLGSVAIIEVLPLGWDMWQDVRSGRYGIDMLAATAIITSVILGQYWAAMVVVLMLTGGEGLEDFAEHRARTELDSLLKHAPETAHVIRKGKTLSVAVSQLHVGDKLLIKAGELVPTDAVIIEGTASFDEASLTGESLPQTKQVGSQLLSGSINLDGAVTAKATASAEDSQYQQIVKLVRNAAASQAPFVRLADRYSLPFTVLAYAIASAVWVLSGQAVRFLEVIIVATPCPLLLAAPIALISGMARASRYGIIVKTGSALERLAEAKTIAFDKTGTLTGGVLQVAEVTAFGSYTKDEVLALAASLEQNSNHILARAIVADAQAKKLKLAKAKHVQEIAGRGLQATVKGQIVLAGRFSLLEEHGVQLPKRFKPGSIKQTAAYLAVDNVLVGIITLRDELRPESKATIEALRILGLKDIIMVTGDNQATAQLIAKQLGITHIHAETLPANKLHVLEKVKDRPLVFVGDGVNDAPVLTAADVGIALGARGSTAASESADMVIMLDDVSRVATAFIIARRTFQIARQSILVGIGLSVLLMLVFATGKFPPLAGAIIQEVVDVVVIFNALRAHLITVND